MDGGKEHVIHSVRGSEKVVVSVVLGGMVCGVVVCHGSAWFSRMGAKGLRGGNGI